jgi:hypothetical protein
MNAFYSISVEDFPICPNSIGLKTLLAFVSCERIISYCILGVHAKSDPRTIGDLSALCIDMICLPSAPECKRVIKKSLG